MAMTSSFELEAFGDERVRVVVMMTDDDDMIIMMLLR